MTILDPSALEALKDLEEPGVFSIAETIALFLSDTQMRFNAIKTTLSAQDALVLKREAHTIKGNCMAVGAMQLGELCRQLEECGKNAQFESALQLIKRAESEFLAVKNILVSFTKKPEESADSSGNKSD
jgi:HPt (histidine-containing phosphotransfer) domain-containing protein